MMFFSNKIWFTVLVFLPFIAAAQSTPEETMVETTDRVLEIEMTTSAPSPQQLGDFNHRAKQKMEDFADVLTFLEDEKIEMELRVELAKTALLFFGDKNEVIEWYDLKTKRTLELPIDTFLEKRRTDANGLTFQFVNISGIPPDTCPPPQCTWQMDFQIIQSSKNGDSISTEASMTILLKKKEKHFGSAKKEVWDIFLSEIKIQNKRP